MSNQVNMNSIFDLLETLRPTPNDPRYIPSNELIFGEEQKGYFPIPGEERNLEFNQFYHVKTLSDKITTHLYTEPKFGDEVKSIYAEIINIRRKQGFVGLRGKNKKGIICALIVIILYRQGVNIDFKKLVSSANKVDNNTNKVTLNMIIRYINDIISILKTSGNDSTQNNSNVEKNELRKEIKRIGIKMHLNQKNIISLTRKHRDISSNLFSFHTPYILASSIIFKFLSKNNSKLDKKLLKQFDVTPSVLKKALSRLYPNTVSAQEARHPRSTRRASVFMV